MTKTDALPRPPLPALADCALFLDFDGTLVELAETPDAIEPDPGLPALLAALHAATGGAMALVTGRGVDDLLRHLPGFPGTIVGGHGAERRHEGARESHPAATGETLAQATDALHDFAEGRDGLLVEEKATGTVLHYRRAPEREAEVQDEVSRLAEAHPEFERHDSKMAAELRPSGIGKDKAILELMERAPFAGRRPIFAGDDTTDEPALAWVAARGGLSIRVGGGATNATSALSDPAEMRAELARWLAATEETDP